MLPREEIFRIPIGVRVITFMMMGVAAPESSVGFVTYAKIWFIS